VRFIEATHQEWRPHFYGLSFYSSFQLIPSISQNQKLPGASTKQIKHRMIQMPRKKTNPFEIIKKFPPNLLPIKTRQINQIKKKKICFSQIWTASS
jgi:hypothetical protein